MKHAGKNKTNIRKMIMAVAAVMIGACCFCSVYGTRILDPAYTPWLMNNTGGGIDPAQHYLGWRYYRNSGWLFPPGMLDNLAYPLRTSVIFTDSIPAAALIFKALSPVLPGEFQYFGLYGAFCFCLQSLFGTLITYSLCRICDGREGRAAGDLFVSVLGGLLFTLSPVLTDRMFHHTALASHWMILMGIWLFFGSAVPGGKDLKDIICWGILGYLAGAVHLYYLPMTGIFCAASALVAVVSRKSARPLLFPVTYLGCALAAVWLFGGFSAGVSAEGDGLGDYSFNLNGFINPAGTSSLMKELSSAFPGQNEGFSYLGAGVFLLLAVVLIIHGLRLVYRASSLDDDPGKKPGKEDGTRAAWTVMTVLSVMIFAAMLVFSLSPVVTAGERVLFSIPIHSKTRHLWNIFRSTGRMIWVCVYLLETAGIYGLLKIRIRRAKLNAALQAVILTLCIALQIFDLEGWYSEKRSAFSREQTYETELKGEYWDSLARESRHLFVSDAVTSSESRVMETAEWAVEHGLTLNNFYFARGVPGVREEYNKRMATPSEGELYLFTPEDPELERAGETLELSERGRYVAGIPK